MRGRVNGAIAAAVSLCSECVREQRQLSDRRSRSGRTGCVFGVFFLHFSAQRQLRNCKLVALRKGEQRISGRSSFQISSSFPTFLLLTSGCQCEFLLHIPASRRLDAAAVRLSIECRKTFSLPGRKVSPDQYEKLGEHCH